MPYHFFRFSRFPELDDGDDKHIPSLAHARLSMLEWGDFRNAVIDFGEYDSNGKLADQLP